MIKDGMIAVEFTDADGEEVYISQNINSKGIMVSIKDETKEYKMMFSSFRGHKLFNEQELVEWYNTTYKALAEMSGHYIDEAIRQGRIKPPLSKEKEG